MAAPPVPELLRAHLTELARNDERLDGRNRFEGRKVEIQTGVLANAEGSARVVMGNTIVLAGVKFQIMTPYPDRPTSGGFMTSAEVRPVSGVHWEAGPPSPEAIELGRVVDRGIRESGCLDMNDLCILPGEKAWQVILDVFAVSDDGNLFDAFATAAMASKRCRWMAAQGRSWGSQVSEAAACPTPSARRRSDERATKSALLERHSALGQGRCRLHVWVCRVPAAPECCGSGAAAHGPV